MNLHIAAPQLIYLALTVLGVGFAIAKHGEPKGRWRLSDVILPFVVTLPLLWWGGFFG